MQVRCLTLTLTLTLTLIGTRLRTTSYELRFRFGARVHPSETKEGGVSLKA